VYLSEDQLDFLSAAVRHRDDAERLLSQSPDQAFHLAGFAPECAQKAVLTGRWLDKAVGHLGDPVGEQAIEFALSAEPAAARYRLNLKGPGLPGLAAWRVDCRYERTGTRLGLAPSAVTEAGSLVDEIASALFMDGRIPSEFAW
jgi:hypothetical protein